MKIKLLILGVLACAWMNAQNTTPMLSQSTLTANVLANGQIVNISAPFPFIPSAPLNQGVLYVESEAMLVLSANLALNQLTVQRGYLGTTAASHNAGALVFSGQPFQFVSTDKSGACDPNSPQYLNVTDQTYFTCTGGSWVGATTSNGGGGVGSGTVTNIATSAPLTGGPITTSGTLGCRTATGSLSGCISAADWTTFNAKQSALTLPLSVANGGTGTASPGLVQGTNVTITGSWPNQTVNSSGGGGSGWSIGLLSALPGTCTTGAGYFATDQPALQQLYTCSSTNTWTQGFVNLGGSGALAVTGGSLDITIAVPLKSLANIFSAINHFNAGIQLGVFSAAGTPLPTCNGGALGLLLAVSDATTPTYNGAYTSGGAVGVPVYCDGTSWATH